MVLHVGLEVFVIHLTSRSHVFLDVFLEVVVVQLFAFLEMGVCYLDHLFRSNLGGRQHRRCRVFMDVCQVAIRPSAVETFPIVEFLCLCVYTHACTEFAQYVHG